MRPGPARALTAALFGAALVLAPSGDSAPRNRAHLVGEHVWPAGRVGLGGFSGLEVAKDGMTFTAVSDAGWLVTGRFRRAGGAITGIEDLRKVRLRDTEGRSIQAKWQGDAEALAIRRDGRRYIAFEGMHRVWAYLSDRQAAWLPRHPAFRRLPPNRGIEALAVDGRGQLYALAEAPDAGSPERFTVFRYRKGRWDTPFAIGRRGKFVPVGADFGPDGRLYLLERHFTGLAFRSRVRVFDILGERISEAGTLLETPAGRHGNLEGLAVWRDAAGRTRLTMLSDDNFHFYLTTEFVEYVLDGDLATGRETH